MNGEFCKQLGASLEKLRELKGDFDVAAGNLKNENRRVDRARFDDYKKARDRLKENLEKDENFKIWEEVANGNFQNIEKLTILPAFVAKKIGERLKRRLIHLDGLQSISLDATQELAKSDGSSISLDGIAFLSDEVIEALSRHEGQLGLDGLVSLSDKGAKFLGNNGNKEGISLRGLESLSDTQAMDFASHDGFLMLGGLNLISAETARILGNKKGDIDLSGLTSLSDEVAEHLGEKKHGRLYLGGITSLSLEIAKKLVKNRKLLFLDGIEILPKEIAEVLTQGEVWLVLYGLKSISDEVANIFAKYKFKISLPVEIEEKVKKFKT